LRALKDVLDPFYSLDENPFLMRAHETREKHFRFGRSVGCRQIALQYEFPLGAAPSPYSGAVDHTPYINADSENTYMYVCVCVCMSQRMRMMWLSRLEHADRNVYVTTGSRLTYFL
jgi:hypothetical protein